MKKLAALILLWLAGSAWVLAAIPQASFNLAPLDNQHWPARYRLTLEVPKDHHAYLDRGEENAYIPVKLDPAARLASAGLTLSEEQSPVGEQDAKVKARVLRNRGDFLFTLAQMHNKPLSADATELEVRYQLCNEITNVCFRPQTAHINIPLPPPQNTVESPAEQATGLMDKVLALFHDNQNNLPLLFGLMLFAGLLSVATPCVYPMLPITSVFINGRANGEAKSEKQHALWYFAGMVATYMLLGLIAGMTGGAFNTLMQSAWANIGFAVFFAFFAIALLGFYELSFLQNEVYSLDRKSSGIKGLGGTFLMGSLAGLVISPCVGPIVFALLLQVADNIAAQAASLAAVHQTLGTWDKLLIAGQGSIMMAGFGLGVGLPFFIISTLKVKKLPKAGHWMTRIKYAFGFIILYFAYTYLEKGMGLLGAEATTIHAFAFGLLILWLAIMHCDVLTLLPKDAPSHHKIQHFAGVISVIIGSWLVVASLGKLPLSNNAQANTTAQNCGIAGSSRAAPLTNAAPVQYEAGIPWYRSYAAAQQAAQQTGKPIFIDFYASWCANCVEFKKQTAHNAALNQALKEKAIALKLIDQEPEFEKFKADSAHRQLKIGLPYFAILSPQGSLQWSGTDYTATSTMIAQLN